MTTPLLLVAVLAAAPTSSAFQPRARNYDAQSYKIEMRLEEDGTFKNRLTAKLKATKAVSEFEMDAYNLKVELALVDNAAATPKLKFNPALKEGTVTIKPAKPIAAGKEFVVEIVYSGKAGTANEGFFTVNDNEDEKLLPYYFTHFEPSYAQRFYPCNDQPNDKATTEVLAIVDSRYTVLSNGKKDLDETFTEGGKNLRRVHWAQEKPHAPYLLAIAIGQFEAVEVSKEIPSTVWVAPGRKDRAFVTADALPELLRTEAAFVGVKYPWEKLDVVALPHFYWSGMENTGLIFNRDAKVLVDHKNDMLTHPVIVGLLAHEMAHQWFGNDVTCSWWDETWLNEGFATYLGAMAEDAYNDSEAGEIDMTTRLVESYFQQESGPRAHALVGKGGATPEDVFDSVSYIKGAQVLRMLELWVGKAEFKKVLKAYLEKYAYSSANSNDFFKVLFDTTKKEKELKPFKEAWLTKRGYPVIFPEATYANGKLNITIRQQPSATGEKGAFVFKLPIVMHRETEPSFTKEDVLLIDKAETKISIDCPAAPQWINWNKNFGALVKVNTSAVSEQNWVDAARNDPDPTWRLIATWNLLGEIVNPDATTETMPTDAAMNAALDVLTKDPSPFVRTAVLDRIADTRFKKLPKQFATVALALAKRPENMNEDPVGYIEVRSSAMEVLGRSDSTDGHAYILEELSKRDIDINYLPAFAASAARMKEPAGLTTLRSAISTQKSRGYAYYKRTLEALGSVESADAVPVIREVLKANPGNNEVARKLFGRLDDNKTLKDTPDFAHLVRDIVLAEADYTEEMRSDAIQMLDTVKTDDAKETLKTIAEKVTSDRLKASANHTLEANFPAAPAAAPAKKDAKKK